ncbi:hypothetical protein ACFC1T_09360 [Kitasatospora sp. NPDC056076]|uniref:hypothetical protein n=1 Tax=Kitasatospora sp. NPDC056076 TaxID=3345703 RepID=UPI0035DD9379
MAGRRHLRVLPSPMSVPAGATARQLDTHAAPGPDAVDAAEWRYLLGAFFQDYRRELRVLPTADILLVGWNVSIRPDNRTVHVPYAWDDPCDFSDISSSRATVALQLLVALGLLREDVSDPGSRFGYYTLLIPPDGYLNIGAAIEVWNAKPKLEVARIAPQRSAPRERARPASGRRGRRCPTADQLPLFDQDPT